MEMSYQEKKSVAYLIGTITTAIIYYVYVFQIKAEQSFNPETDFRFWGVTFLLIIPTLIVVNILIQVIFNVLHVAITKEEGEQFEDELDKNVELRANRNAYTIFLFAFMGSIGSLAFGAPPHVMFNCLFASVMLGSGTWGVSMLYFYRRGF